MLIFLSQEAGELLSGPITESQPNEMKKLVDQNQPQQARPPQKLTFQHDFAFPDKAGGINRDPAARLPRSQFAAISGQFRLEANLNRPAGEFREFRETAH